MIRTRDYIDESRYYRPELLRELNLDVSPEELLSAERAFTYADVCGMLESGDTILWLTPHAAVVNPTGIANLQFNESVADDYKFSYFVDGKEIIAVAGSSEKLLEICDVVLRLLAASFVHSVQLCDWSCPGDASINATSLAYLMEQCQSLQALTLEQIVLDEDQIRVIGAYSRPDIKIELIRCEVQSAGTSTLAEVLGQNQGPTSLVDCEMDNAVLANGLRGNSRLKCLILRYSRNNEDGNREVLATAGALKENKGLVDLGLRHDFRLCNETWYAVCDALKTHPTLQVFDIILSTGRPVPPMLLNSRMQALLNMMKMNRSIHTVHLSHYYSQHAIYVRSVIPYLETNRFRLRVRAIQTTHPIPFRAKLLGRALLSARTDANSFWMLLSGNAEVAFLSRTTAIATIANFSTPVTAAATSCANDAAVATSMIAILTTTASVVSL
jgi:hypothetical protein